MLGLKKCVLAYSGGLDTSVMIRWISEKLGYEVIAVIVDVGQEEDLDFLVSKALKIGAVKSLCIDAKKEFVEKYIFKAIKSNAMYQGAYPLSTALARPLIAKKVVDVAIDEGANIVAHGCTGKGNDQVRFETSFKSLAPNLEILAPVREWGMMRDEEIEYAVSRNIPIPKKSRFSIDQNLWGRSIEGAELEDMMVEPPEEAFEWTVSPEKAPDSPAYVELEFEDGVPVRIDGKEMAGLELIEKLNNLVGSHGVGRIDHIEDRVVGIRSREIYEAPAAVALISAHMDLEKAILTKAELEAKSTLEDYWTRLVYYGLWMDPCRQAIDAFFDHIQKRVEGKVRIKLFKGSMRIVGRQSRWSLYDKSLAMYEKGSTFDQSLSKGFIQLFSLSTVTANKVMKKLMRT
ncbi:MAG: argininosuccinate synthase [Thermoproteota archaeon]